MNWDNVREMICSQDPFDKEFFYQKSKRIIFLMGSSVPGGSSVNGKTGYSIRVLNDQKLGMAFSEQNDLQDLNRTIQKAHSISKFSSNEPYHSFYASEEQRFSNKCYNERLDHLSVEAKQRFLNELQDQVLHHAQVRKINTLLYNEYYEETVIINKAGLFKRSISNWFFLFMQIMFQSKGGKRIGENIFMHNDLAGVDHEEFVKELVTNQVNTKTFYRVKSGIYPAVLSNRSASKIFSALFGNNSPFFASTVHSRFHHQIGSRIGSDLLTFYEEPNRKVQGKEFDVEGVATHKFTICQNGILVGLYHNLYTANKDHTESTGHGFRKDYKSNIAIQPVGVFLEQGTHSDNELLAELHQGVWIEDVDNLDNGVNILTGDVTISGKGYYVQKGKVSCPMSNFLVSFNFYELFLNIKGKSNRCSDNPMRIVNSPALLVDNVNILPS